MKYAFITTHYGSGASILSRILNENSRICSYGASNLIYDHPTKLELLREQWNAKSYRSRTEAHLYIDKLMINQQMCCKKLYEMCKFIYMIREPEGTIPNIISRGYTPENAALHYAFRLRRLCEMAIKTGGVLITFSEMIKDHTRERKFKMIEEYLGLKTSLGIYFSPSDEDPNLQAGKLLKYPLESKLYASDKIMEWCDNIYKRYFTYLTGAESRLHC